jgi:predicted thioredoxin/glutaredoxin
MIVKVFLSCCGGEKLLQIVNEAVLQSGTNAQVEVVEDLAAVAKEGIMSTPAIKIDNQLVVSGRVPKVQDLVTLLKNNAAK